MFGNSRDNEHDEDEEQYKQHGDAGVGLIAIGKA
jgi:hypothetical protein